MGEEHLYHFAQAHRDGILFGLGDVAGDLTGIFVFFAGDGSGIGVRAALPFRRAGLAGQFQGAVFGPPLTGRTPVRIGIVPAELFQLLALGADVLVVLGVPFKVRPAPGAVDTAGFVEDGNMRGDLAIDQPAQHRPGAVEPPPLNRSTAMFRKRRTMNGKQTTKARRDRYKVASS